MDDSSESEVVKFVVVIICLAFIFAFATVVIPRWIGAGRNAKVINKEFGTHYTTAEIFWAGDTIKEIIVGRRNNVMLEKK